jgi:hypothetical protein
MNLKLDFTWIRIATGIIVYLTMLGLAAVATFALLAGPQWFGITESWPLVFYFVVPYLGTLLAGIGVVAVIRYAPGFLRRAF